MGTQKYGFVQRYYKMLEEIHKYTGHCGKIKHFKSTSIYSVSAVTANNRPYFSVRTYIIIINIIIIIIIITIWIFETGFL